MNPQVRPGEMARTAFISSVMDDEMTTIRERVEVSLRAAPYLVPWTFESAPASSEEVEEGFLRKVRESRVVIWLVGDRTTEPVEKEIHEALAAENCDLLVFLLPAKERDTRTEDLTARIKPHARYRELSDLDQLEVEVETAINDTVIRALAGEPSISRAGRLELLGRESRARCIQRWQASGLELDLARRLADDMDVGARELDHFPGGGAQLVVLVAEGGSGKSLASERFIQSAITAQLKDAAAPVPIFVRARDVVGKLREAMLAEARGLGDPRTIGAVVVVDGADEAADGAALLLAEARELAQAWPQTRVVISSRPISAFDGVRELRPVPRLSAQEAREVVAIGAGRPVSVGEAAGWPQPVRDAIEVPLFALLVGLHIARNGDLTGLSRVSLLSELAEHALVDASPETRPALRRLAVLSIRRGGNRIPQSELGSGPDIDALEASRLVAVRDREFWFPLALMAQWFAAESLAEGHPSGDELAGNPEDLELWRFPLAILASTASHRQAVSTLGPIASAHPGFLSQVVDEAITRWQTVGLSGLPRKEAGERIREAMSCWLQGLAPLNALLFPQLDPDGSGLPPLGVEADGDRLVVGWYAGADELADVARLPVDLRLGPDADAETVADWPQVRGASPSRQASWALRWTLDELTSRLADLLQDRRLSLTGTDLEGPRLWRACRAVLGLPDSYALPIAVAQAATRVNVLLEGVDESPYRTPSHPIDLLALIARLEQLRQEGVETVEPARLEVEPSSGIVIPRSAQNEIALAHVTAVYETALQAYSQVTESVFKPLCGFLQTSVLLPACLRGSVYGVGIPGTNHADMHLQWWLVPLPSGEESRVELRIEDPREDREQFVERWDKEATAAIEKARLYRPEQARWIDIFLRSHRLDAWGPLAPEEIVYDWLWRDLRRIMWVHGELHEAPYKLLP